MLVASLIIIIVLLILLLASMTGMNLKNVQLAEHWYAQWKKSDDDYQALEQGRDEESEAYEQQYLSFMDTIEHQSTAISSYIEDLLFLVDLVGKHYDDCLPDLGDDKQKRYEAIRSQILLQEG